MKIERVPVGKHEISVRQRWLDYLMGAIVLLCFRAVVAPAHPVAQGAIEVAVFADAIRLEVRSSTEEMSIANAVASDAGETPDHAAYLLKHLRVFADGILLPGSVAAARGDARPPGRTPGGRATFRFEYALPFQPHRIELSQDILNEVEFAPGNRWEATYIVAVREAGRPAGEGSLLTSKNPASFDCGAALSNRWRLARDYLAHGIWHILTGYDHLLFISALTLATLTWWDLVKVVSAFTLAHSCTLTLSVLNIVRLPEKIVEPMIAASIVCVALQNLFSPETRRGTMRLAIAFFFGLFHGLGFAGGLLEAMSGLPGLSVGVAIVAFSLGVEIGHQVVVLPLFGILRCSRGRLRGEAESQRFAEGLVRAGSAAISLAGMFYFVAALR